MCQHAIVCCFYISSDSPPPSAVPGVPQEKAGLAKELHEKSTVLAGIKDKTKAYVAKLNADKVAAIGALEAQVRVLEIQPLDGDRRVRVSYGGEISWCPVILYCEAYLFCFVVASRQVCGVGGISMEGYGSYDSTSMEERSCITYGPLRTRKT